MLQLNKFVKLIIASGDTANGHVQEALSAGAIDIMSKPCQLKSFKAKIHEVLDRSGTSKAI